MHVREKRKRTKGSDMETKYKIGEVVYIANTVMEQKQHDCPDCLGSRKWTATSPAGEKHEFSCPRCSGAYHSNDNMRLTYSWNTPTTRMLTIGSVRTDTHDKDPISYMCKETGVGSGSIYRESIVFSNKEDALKKAVLMCAENNQRDERIVKQYKGSLSLSDYQFSEIRNLESVIKGPANNGEK